MGRAREFMSKLLRRNGSSMALEDKATQCTSEHVRKLSFDATSISSEFTDPATDGLQQFMFDSYRSTGSLMSNNSTRRVDFGEVQVRFYEQVVGDHPLCSSGCPLSLGWNYSEQEMESVSEHEDRKEHVRKSDELRMTDDQRYERLVANEVTDLEIRRCLRRLHRERECSLRCQSKAKAQFFM